MLGAYPIFGVAQRGYLLLYVHYRRQTVTDLTSSWETLLATWREPDARDELTTKLTRASIYPDVLAEVLDESDVDDVDILGHVVYDRALLTRYDRDAREVLYALCHPLADTSRLGRPMALCAHCVNRTDSERSQVLKFTLMGDTSQKWRHLLCRPPQIGTHPASVEAHCLMI